jgi:Flp pilus assembly protein TadG
VSGLKSLAELKKSDWGQAVVEFALVLPVILILVLGSIDAGWLLYAKISTTAAAREAARAVSVLDKTEYGTFQSVADAKATTVPGNEAVDVSLKSYSEGAPVTVTVTTTVSPLVGFLPTSIIPNPATITSQVSMRLE